VFGEREVGPGWNSVPKSLLMLRLSEKKSTAVTTKPEKAAAAACSIQSEDVASVPTIDTIVPGMGTPILSLSRVLFGQSRRSILALLYGHADEQFYFREIARRAGTGIGATQRELGQLTDAGLLHRLRRGNQVYFRANRKNLIFEELKSILAKTSGIRDILQEGLAPLADRVKLAFVYGSIARGDEEASSDVDLMVVGKVSFKDVVAALSEIERKLGREVNPTVFGPREFREKLAAKNHFLSTVAKEKKLFVIGDEREFRRLGQ
jgi:predicted nucleotidyltransferase